MSAASALITALAALITSLGVVGLAIRFVWSKIDKRIEDLQRDVADCENRHHECEEATSQLRIDQARQGVITRLLFEQLVTVAPDNSVVRQLRAELRAAFPIDGSIPDDMRALLARMNYVRGVG